MCVQASVTDRKERFLSRLSTEPPGTVPEGGGPVLSGASPHQAGLHSSLGPKDLKKRTGNGST